MSAKALALIGFSIGIELTHGYFAMGNGWLVFAQYEYSG